MAHISANSSHLNAITKNGSTHLAVVRQTSNWSNKELIVTPIAKKFTWVSAHGVPAYANDYGPNVLADTQSLVGAVGTLLTVAGWTDGDKALFSLSARANSPYHAYRNTSNWASYSEYSLSAVALKFNLRQLPLSKMSSVSAYVRAYQPSLMFSRIHPYTGQPIAYRQEMALYQNCSRLSLCLLSDLPSHASDIDGADCETFELFGNCNNGIAPDTANWDNKTPTQDFQLYDPFDNMSLPGNGNEAYLPTPVYAYGGSDPIVFYHDIQLTSTRLNWLKTHTGTFWLCAKFGTGNCFSNQAGSAGLYAGCSAMSYIQRLELRLVLTGDQY